MALAWAARLWIIPARAGFTPDSAHCPDGARDHPRSRGVYSTGCATTWPRCGSSPLARGLPHRHRIRQWDDGDHPRSRGVYHARHGIGPSAQGSSPLARGLLYSRFYSGAADGIIPARAGFTEPVGDGGVGARDHPRSRGVYGASVWCRCVMWGSSPLARGLLFSSSLIGVVGGIIPARAGFTSRRLRGRLPGQDHPRSRGVYLRLPAASASLSGSSPLARGLLQTVWNGIKLAGIIPARAGFTRILPHGRVKNEDHPRSRGVYGPEGHADGPEPGSSPLARGLPWTARAWSTGRRIIPARAGFTPPPAHPETLNWDHPRSRGVYTCESLESQRTRSLPDPCCLHCRPRARSAELR